jgi:hypothetical protein
MKAHRRIATAAATLLALAASLMLASAASAHDRNRDRLPDRWERAHHLSLHVNQARRDQDHDGLNNRGEFKAHLNPRKADTDGDGTPDGEENAGTIASFDSATGTLSITLAGGGTLTGQVTGETEIECPATASAADDGDGDHNGGADDNEGDENGSAQGDDNDQGDDDHHHGDCHHGQSCGTDALTTSRTVREAEVKTEGGQAVFEEVKLG